VAIFLCFFLFFVHALTNLFAFLFQLDAGVGRFGRRCKAKNAVFPTSLAECRRQSELFRRDGRNPFRGCVSAMDGLAVKIQRPRLSDVPNPAGYYDRKKFFAVNVQAAVGSYFMFQFCSVATAGSCHDSTAFAASGLEEHLDSDDCFPEGYWAAADDAYPAGRQVLTPWPGLHLLWERDAFNYWQSSPRIFVEQTFGQLVGRWGILWKPLRFPLRFVTQVLRVCAKLHKFLKDRASCDAEDLLEHDAAGGSGEVHLQGDCDLDETRRNRNRAGEKFPLRVAKTRGLKRMGIRRPA